MGIYIFKNILIDWVIVEQWDCNTANQNTIYPYLAILLIKRMCFTAIISQW